jgi:hypothetical protein
LKGVLVFLLKILVVINLGNRTLRGEIRSHKT